MLSVFVAAAVLQSQQTEIQTDWVRKDHIARIAGKTVKYQTTAGMMPIRSKVGDVEGRIFFSYYRRTDAGPAGKRPITFVFNGGPGSASVWLHLGFAGPKRPKMGTKEGFMPSPPYELVTNDESILPESDIVNIDPVGTGYSRPNKPEDGAKFWGVDVDINSVGEFVRSFLSTEGRWLSPIFVMGESYGGIRGAGLSNWLHRYGIGLNGLILVSPLIGPAVADTTRGNDARFAFSLPTMAATGWYHKRLSPEMQSKTAHQVYEEALRFARQEYFPALGEGDKLSPEKQKEIAAKLSALTGLTAEMWETSKLRISTGRWYKELLRSDKRLIGRYDSRFVHFDLYPDTDRGGEDPSYTQVQPAYTSGINDYLANDLGYKTTLKYYILGEGIGGPWKYPEGGPLDMSNPLRQALSNNPYTKVMVTMGYYDVACTMGANDELLDRLQIDPKLRGNIVRTRYEAGHMIYLDDECRRQLHADVAKFIKDQSNPTAPSGSFKRGN